MKRTYQAPRVKCIHVQTTEMMAASITGVSGNSDLNYGGGGSGPAYSREQTIWDGDAE